MMTSDEDTISTLTISTVTNVHHRSRSKSKSTHRDDHCDTIYEIDETSHRGFRQWKSVAHHAWSKITNNRKGRLSLYLVVLCTVFIQHQLVSVHDPFDETIPLWSKASNFLSYMNPFHTNQYEYTTINTNKLVYTATSDPDFDATQPPPGYPFHRWNDSRKYGMTGYPLNVEKFVSILNKMGRGEITRQTVEQGLKSERSFRDFVRISDSQYSAQPYLVKRGKVMRPFGKYPRWTVYKWHHQGHHIDWVTLLESAVSMAKSLEHKNPRMKLITEGEFPIIFDEFDYPWCGDDLVPIFRPSGFTSEEQCTHQWPSLSLNYILPQRDQWLKDEPDDWDVQHEEFHRQYPWEEKLHQAVWRGRYTGYRAVYDRGILPRENLVLYASNHQDIMNVQPVSWQRAPNDQTGELMQVSADQISFLDFMKYRAIIDIDSNGASTRFGPLLCMNSVVIKIQPRFGSYWDHEVKPWVHYIPVEADLSDLKKQVAFAVSNRNQKQMQQIIHNANAWCRHKMIWEQHTLDFLWTLLDYAELLDKAPKFNEKWTADRFAYRLPKLEMAKFEGLLTV